MSSSITPRHQRPSRWNHILFGVVYYPEHWTAEDRRDDVRLMAEAGVNTVRMAEFAWDRMEPQEGVFDFSFFDEAIRELAAAGISTILCTPTAAPPRWLTEAHPDWLRVDADGRMMAHGSRQHVCTTHPGFREASRRITRAMAEHFSGNRDVIGWQTDNELNCHFPECHCEACQSAFRQWLEAMYGGVAALNAAWGTVFWAQTYDRFEQVRTPLIDRPTHPNPSQQLDYFRFLSDAVVAFHRDQTRILREANRDWWITHNGMFPRLDYWKLAGDLDFLGVDVYPGFADKSPEAYAWAACLLEDCRAVSGAFVVPEQQAGPGGQRPYLHRTPQPGQMRLWAWQAVAHGADGLLHFRWRTCRFGAEMYWCGILDQDNVPRRRYQELAVEGAEFRRLGAEIAGTVEFVEAGILTENDQDEAHATMPQQLPAPWSQRRLIFEGLAGIHRATGFVDARDSLSGLKWIFLPSFVLVDKDLAGRLDRFVAEGGLLIATPRTATRDRNNHVLAETPPGFLSGLFGVRVEEFGKLDAGERMIGLESEVLPCGEGYEILEPLDAEVHGVWQGTPAFAAADRPAITVRRHGAGQAVYLGTWFSQENREAILRFLLSRHPLEPLALANPCVEITRRHDEQHTLTFVLNHHPEARKVTGLSHGTELISGDLTTGTLEVPGYGVKVVRSST